MERERPAARAASCRAAFVSGSLRCEGLVAGHRPVSAVHCMRASMLSEGTPVQDVRAGRRAYGWVRYVPVAFVVLATVLLFFVHAAQTQRIEVYVCSVPLPQGVPRECSGPLDVTTCADLEASVCTRSSCGYKLAEYIDISVAGAPDPWAKPTPTDATAAAMVAWSLVPYALVLVMVAWVLYAANTTSLACLALILVSTAVNEGVIKHIFKQPRPTGSCLYFMSCGMPSGHAQSSIGMLVYLLLETWVDRPRTPTWHKVSVSSGFILLLAPVPYSRAYLHDHWPQQVVAGAVEGTFFAVAFFAFMYFFARQRLEGWMSGTAGRVLTNTYRVREETLPVLSPPLLNNA